MKLTAFFAVVLATFASMVAGQNATVVSKCPFTVFLQSFPYDGSAAGPFTVIKPGGVAYTEKFLSGGSTIKLSNKRTLANPLFSSYTNQQSMIYYSLDDQYGNPFAAYRNKLVPTGPSCQRFNCAANNAACYSSGGSKVYGCAKPLNITTTLCAA